MSNTSMRVTLAFLLASAALVAAQITCTPKVEGASWDLTTLAHEEDYKGQGPPHPKGTTSYNYVMNFCQVAKTAGECVSEKGAICQYNIDTAKFVDAIAYYDPSKLPTPKYTLLEADNPSAGITLTYLNGDTCLIGVDKKEVPRQATINMHCASSTDTTFKISEKEETCVFTIDLNAKEACPTSTGGGLSPGSIILVSFAVVIFLYLCIGIGLQKRKGETGRGLCPNTVFWSSLFPLVGEGIKFTIHKCKTFRKSGETYDEL